VTLTLRDPQTLDDLLNYRLLRLYALSGAPVIRLLEGRYGISRREWRLLALLAAHGEMSPSALAEQAHLDRPRATRGVQMLVQKRLAQRSAQQGDARRAHVKLTPSGAKLYEELFPQIAAINARLVETLDLEVALALDKALTRLTDEALRLNQATLRDLRADRRAGLAHRARTWAEVDDAADGN
jgi:DNA-binding MarR family transcriptional regulator